VSTAAGRREIYVYARSATRKGPGRLSPGVLLAVSTVFLALTVVTTISAALVRDGLLAALALAVGLAIAATAASRAASSSCREDQSKSAATAFR
jgi:hypothetical protein